MKNRTKFVGIIAIVALVGFFFVACEGDRGPAGRLAWVDLTVLEGDSAPGTVEASLPFGGAWWNSVLEITAAPTGTGGWVADLADIADPYATLATGAAAARNVATGNFIRQFTVRNPSEFDIPVRIDITNDVDFELHLDDPWVFYPDPTGTPPAAPPSGDFETDPWFNVYAPAGGDLHFWVTSRTGSASGDAAAYTHHWVPLGSLTVVPTNAAAGNPAAGPALRTTVVEVEIHHAFAAWARFSGEGRRYTFPVNVTVTAP